MNNELWFYNVEFIYYEDLDKTHTKCIVAGYSFADVVGKIENFYGEDCIENISAELIDETEHGIYEVSHDVMEIF